MPKSLKELLDERQKLITDDRKLLDDEGLSAADRCEKSDKLNADIDGLDKQIEELRDVDRRKERAGKREEKVSAAEIVRQTDRLPAAAQERLKLMLGKHEMELAKDNELAVRSTPEYLKAFDAYVLGRQQEALGLVTSKDDKGGYAAPVVLVNRLIKFMDDMVFMRRLGTVLPPIPQAVSLGALSYDADPGDADWTAEVPASDIAEDDSIEFGKREMLPHLDTKLVKASDKFLRAAANLPGGAANFIGDRLNYKFGITEEKVFLSGTGVQRPLGVFTADSSGVPTARDFTCSSTTAFTADDLIGSLYALKPQYQERATGLFHRDAVKMIRKLKDGTGQYMWQPGLVAGQPDRILNRPYVQSEYVPNTFTTGLYVGMWADFSWYWIVDSLAYDIKRLDELFALRNQVGFLGRKETDGMPVLAEAFSRLKLA